MEFERFDQIENKVGQLLESFKIIKEERDKLAALISEKDAEIETLGEEVRRLNDEKTEARTRVDNLLARLDEINLEEIIAG